MPDLDERAVPFRDRMVDALGAGDIADARVLDAMRRVPRHRFVERFVGAPPGEQTWSVDTMREWVVDEAADDETLAIVHDVTRALPAPGSTRFTATTAVSAPNIVAAMLELLELEPGMRVLEIGAGSGYNAALIADLVGDPALVTTVDIDSTLIEPARRRLALVGCDAVEVVDGDGDVGAAHRAPFDRIVATVGCNDLSPAWFDQLAPTGWMIVPLRHGGPHPLVRATADRTSRIVGSSGFVAVQGRQDQPVWWTGNRTPVVPERMTWTASHHQGAMREDSPLQWDIAYYVALRDVRAGWAQPMLSDGESVALLDRVRGIGTRGPQGSELAERLVAVLDDWVALGGPELRRYRATWQDRRDDPHIDSSAGPWRIPRVHHDQVVTLDGVQTGDFAY